MTALKLAPDLTLPLDAVTQRLAFLGRVGSGKTYAATKLAELMLAADAQIVALDPVGVWWGLRVPATSTAFPIPIFGGLHGDVPLDASSGALVADLIVNETLSCVLDVSQFATDREKVRFATDFGERFYARQKAQPSAVHLFLEECQEFVPQNVARGEEQMLHVWARLAKLGRNYGIGISLISQRPQEVNKKVLNLTEAMFAFQMRGEQERKTMKAWATTTDASVDMVNLLPTLAVGDAWLDSPQWLKVARSVRVSPKRTADVSSTPTVGARATTPKMLEALDLPALREQMAATVEQAKADDPKALRAQIRELQRDLITAASTNDDDHLANQLGAATAELQELRRDNEEFVREINAHFGPALGGANESLKRLGDVVTVLAALRERLIHRLNYPPDTVNVPRAVAARTVEPVRTLRPRDNGGGALSTIKRIVARADGVTGVEQRILNTIAGMTALGVAQPDRATVAALVGYHPGAKSYANAMGSLRTAGKIEYVGGGRIELTPDGALISENSLPVRSRAELHALWIERLGNVAGRILAPVLAAYPDSVPADVVAAEAGYHPGAKSYANMKGRLRTLGLIDYPRPGEIVATKVLFPEGLRR